MADQGKDSKALPPSQEEAKKKMMVAVLAVKINEI
jgi:hypothetical protein